MDETMLVMGMVGVTIALFIAGVATLVGGRRNAQAEDRLDGLVSGRRKQKADKLADSLLRPPVTEAGRFVLLERFVPSMDRLRALYEQADVDLDFERFLSIAAGLGVLGAVVGYFLLPPLLIPLGAAGLAALPFLWLMRRKKKRIKEFLDALPEAVELMGRALRAGHGLASGFQLVAAELKGPLADEFFRVFEEQNLGVPLETALRGMADRVPAMDVRFLVTAIIIQRATGGDLAEVLDKIGKLVRQRFELFGHVKALTAEGRLSGIVLLALPPGLLVFLATTNYGYIAPMFETAAGTKMLIATAVLQVLGAVSINKIVSIKV